jgi:hypothetical protein
MRVALLFLLCACVLIPNLSAGTIGYSVTALGPSTYHYDYLLSGVPFVANEELDIRFDPTIFASLSNGVAGNGFLFIPCCQPNNPPGVFGDYEIIALSNISMPTGSFGVDVTVFAGASLPGSQPFFLNQLDSNGVILFNISAGFTEAGRSAPDAAPEPSAASLLAIGLLAGASWGAFRKFRRPRVGEA